MSIFGSYTTTLHHIYTSLLQKKLKQTLLYGLKINLKPLHKPPTSPVPWEVLSVKWVQAIYSAVSWKTISLWCSPSLVSRELSAFNLFMYCTVLCVNRRQGERRKIVVRYKSWTSKLWGRWLKGRHEEAVSIVSFIVPESQQKAILTVAFTNGRAPPDLWLVHHSSDYRPLNSKTVCSVMAIQSEITQNVPKVEDIMNV